ncbi:N-acetyl-alpha-D-glucosaminyl L-malate synthase [Abditibacteriota bacterium]|nr:N-acetyl-alpha-D-glucosaminyl L-malate synthase [Abditibacteriota bacterium]
MKIAFVSTLEHARWGGSEELWARTALRLKERGHEIYISVQWWQQCAPQVANLERVGCRVNYRRPPSLIERVAQKKWPSRKFEWLDVSRPDLVVISQGGYYDGLRWMEECAARNINYVTVAQNAPEFHWPEDDILGRVQDSHHKSLANYFVAQGNIDLVARQTGNPVQKAKVVRNPFNVAYGARPGWPKDQHAFRLACVAQLLPVHKGQDLIFEVLRLPHWKVRSVQVTLVGKGPNQHSLAALKARYGLENVTFGGFTTNIEEVWAQNHAMILPSRCEGTPLAVVEAMLCGRMCIVTDVAGNPEIVEDNITGFVAAAPTPSLLDEAMERAWGRRTEWKEMGEMAARSIRELVPSDPIAVFADELMQVVNFQ